MSTKLRLRPVEYQHNDLDLAKGGTPTRFKVECENGQILAWISRMAGGEWQIQREKDGIPGNGTGDYKTAAEAFTVLQEEVGQGA